MIKFTQFLRPNGRQETTSITRPPDIEKMADTIVAEGGRFEIEVLSTGEISMEVVMDGEDDEPRSLAMEICPNGPKVPEAVDRLMMAAAKVLK